MYFNSFIRWLIRPLWENTWSGCVGSTRHCRVDKLAGSGDHSGNHPGLRHPCFPAVWCQKEEALQETIFHASFLAVVAAILFTVGILIGLPGLVGILQVPVDIRPICLDYLYVLFGGIPLMMLYNFTAAMLRAFGDSKTPLTACVIAALFNIALDLYFILELGWGVKGAALATVIAQTLASAYCLWKLCRIEVLAEKGRPPNGDFMPDFAGS